MTDDLYGDDLPDSPFLKIQAAFGESVDSTWMFATHEGEEGGSDNVRSFLLRLKGTKATLVGSTVHGVISAWQSSNGTAYCSSMDGFCLMYSDGVWSEERIVPTGEAVGPIWGISGPSVEDDIVIACTLTSIVVRRGGVWREFPVPSPAEDEIEEVNCAGGPSWDDLLVSTSAGLFHWNGRAFSKSTDPLHGQYLEEDIVLQTATLPDGTVVAVSDDLFYRQKPGGDWVELKGPVSSYGGSLVEFQGTLYASAIEGPVTLDHGTLERVADFESIRLFHLGDALLSASSERAWLLDGKGRWRPIDTPMVAAHSEVTILPIVARGDR